VGAVQRRQHRAHRLHRRRDGDHARRRRHARLGHSRRPARSRGGARHRPRRSSPLRLHGLGRPPTRVGGGVHRDGGRCQWGGSGHRPALLSPPGGGPRRVRIRIECGQPLPVRRRRRAPGPSARIGDRVRGVGGNDRIGARPHPAGARRGHRPGARHRTPGRCVRGGVRPRRRCPRCDRGLPAARPPRLRRPGHGCAPGRALADFTDGAYGPHRPRRGSDRHGAHHGDDADPRPSPRPLPRSRGRDHRRAHTGKCSRCHPSRGWWPTGSAGFP